MFSPTVLWREPEVNPINRKARSIPVFNPINKYGRVFFFSWFGFFVAFWSWYAFPPLLTLTIKKDLKMSTVDVANSNIAALCGTLLVRVFAGPACDRFGPRWTFVATLFVGAIPTALAGTVKSVSGLIALRFFIGILGGSFVPCQVWSTGFFDKNIVGTANSLIGGWGNAGGGFTYFVMPAIYNSLKIEQHLSSHVAWRVAFVVPFIVIVFTGTAMLLLCPDTPSGKWSERHLAAESMLVAHGVDPHTVGEVEKKASDSSSGSATPTKKEKSNVEEPKPDVERGTMTSVSDHEVSMSHQQMVDVARGEIVVAPTFKEAMRVLFSLQTLFHCMMYFCSFGSELAINSALGSYYLKNFPALGQTGSGRWAAMFGLLNVVTRPIGGATADILYKRTGSLWAKKAFITFTGIATGAFLIAIGLTDPHDKSMMFGLIAGAAIFLEAGNGANFALVPHVHPFANGIVSGFTGACGNLGGIVFAIVFRYHGVHYAESFWIIGVIILALSASLSWIKPIPKGQVGGR